MNQTLSFVAASGNHVTGPMVWEVVDKTLMTASVGGEQVAKVETDYSDASDGGGHVEVEWSSWVPGIGPVSGYISLPFNRDHSERLEQAAITARAAVESLFYGRDLSRKERVQVFEADVGVPRFYVFDGTVCTNRCATRDEALEEYRLTRAKYEALALKENAAKDDTL